MDCEDSTSSFPSMSKSQSHRKVQQLQTKKYRDLYKSLITNEGPLDMSNLNTQNLSLEAKLLLAPLFCVVKQKPVPFTEFVKLLEEIMAPLTRY